MIAEQLLAHGAAAWNGGDLDSFVADYADSATFVTSRGLVSGRAAIRGLYAPRFGPGVQRGTLSFENVQVFVLSEGVLHVVAWYVLTGLPTGTQRGPTSLVLVREGEGRWRIAHDHSS
ncbi:MAG TPA: SgcJ/EcaC family oxidoreductase [Gemmatimonadales bacterium]|nr:SgcJ/EcaC family oxidoreductase [Gemmatimonadales bacterium]